MHRPRHSDNHGARDNRVSDMQPLQAGNRRNWPDVDVVESVAGVYLQTQRARRLGAVANPLQLRLRLLAQLIIAPALGIGQILVGKSGIGAGMQLDEVGPNALGCGQLLLIRLDEKTDSDPRPPAAA